MSRVPVITSPCPFRWNGAPQAGQDFCGQCQRQVHNLDGMSASQRETFFAGCGDEVCVSYTARRPVRVPLVIGIGLAAAATLGGAAGTDAPAAAPTAGAEEIEVYEEVLMGGVKTGKELQWVDETEAAVSDKTDLPEIGEQSWLPTPKA